MSSVPSLRRKKIEILEFLPLYHHLKMLSNSSDTLCLTPQRLRRGVLNRYNAKRLSHELKMENKWSSLSVSCHQYNYIRRILPVSTFLIGLVIFEKGTVEL